MNALVKTETQIAKIREAGQIVGSLLFALQPMVIPGVRPIDLDVYAKEYIEKHGATPAFLGYQGFAHTLCISINDAVVHGIPGKISFKKGDLVGIDAGAIVDGWYADGAISLVLPPAPSRAQELLDTTNQALAEGIRRAQAGQYLGDVQAAIQRVIEETNFGIIRDLTGHGIGRALHEEPQIPNYGRAGTGPILKAGMTICLEPMVTVGDPAVYVDQDGWTIRTRDHSLGAQFEHTILITDGEPEILTPIRPWPHLKSILIDSRRLS